MNFLLCRTRLKISPICFGSVRLSSLSNEAFSWKMGLVNEVHSVLTTSTSVESSLEVLIPFLSSPVVDTVISEQPCFELGFRLYVWAMRRRSLRSFVSRNLIIKALCENPGNFEVAWSLLQQLYESGERIAAPGFDVLISAYSVCGNVEKALEIFGRMWEFGCRANTFTYNIVIRILIDQKAIELAMAVYNQMLKRKEWPNRSTFGLLMHGLFKAGNRSDALRLLDEMTDKGIAPNIKIYTILLSGHCKANCLNDAYKLFVLMKRNGCVHDGVSRNILVHGFCKSGRVDEALGIINKEGFQLGLADYSCLIDGLFAVGRFEEACKYYKEMLGKNIPPDLVLYTIMIKGHCNARKIDEAFSFLNEMTSKGFVPDTFCYNTLIKGACDMGLLDKAKSLKLEITKQGNFSDATTYTIMICGLCKEGMTKAAEEIFKEMKELGCLPTVITFNALIDGLFKAGRTKDAQKYFYELHMPKNVWLFLRLSQGSNHITNIEDLRTHVHHLCKSGRIFEAYKLLKDLANSSVVPDLITTNILISGLCKSGDINGALSIFKRMQINGSTPDNITYGTIIHGLCLADRESDAFSLFEQIKLDGITPSRSIYNTLMLATSKKKQPRKVLTLWMESISKSIGEMTELLLKHFDEDTFGEGVNLLVEKELELKCLDNVPYCIMIIAFCRVGKVEAAGDIFNVLKAHDIDISRRCCMLFVTYLCFRGEVGWGMDIFFYALDKGYFMLPDVCDVLISRLCLKGKISDAQMVANRLKHEGYLEEGFLNQFTRKILYGHVKV